MPIISSFPDFQLSLEVTEFGFKSEFFLRITNLHKIAHTIGWIWIKDWAYKLNFQGFMVKNFYDNHIWSHCILQISTHISFSYHPKCLNLFSLHNPLKSNQNNMLMNSVTNVVNDIKYFLLQSYQLRDF